MGLFDDFDIKPEDVKEASGFSNADDGTYEWVISEDAKRNGTPTHPDYTYYTIDYDLDEDGSHREWFTLAVDGDPEHPVAKKSWPWFKKRLLSLGVDPATFQEGDLEGLTGAFRLQTKLDKKNTPRQNIVESSFVCYGDEGGAGDEPSDHDDDSAAATIAARNKRAKEAAPAAPAKPARRTRAAAAVVDDEQVNPFERKR